MNSMHAVKIKKISHAKAGNKRGLGINLKSKFRILHWVLKLNRAISPASIMGFGIFCIYSIIYITIFLFIEKYARTSPFFEV